VSAAVSVAAVILAAGSSSRMGGIKKEYQKININNDSITVLGSSVRAFASNPCVQVIVIAIPKNDEAAARNALPSEYLQSKKLQIFFVDGGNTRSASVYNALSSLKSYNPDYVLIHDGARPWVSTELIQNIINAAVKHNAVIPLLPITDTPKECGEGIIKRHLKRANVGIAQTPQGFNFMQILDAHKKAAMEQEEFTDDAEIWGRFCGDVFYIPGELQNKKITFKEDLN